MSGFLINLMVFTEHLSFFQTYKCNINGENLVVLLVSLTGSNGIARDTSILSLCKRNKNI